MKNSHINIADKLKEVRSEKGYEQRYVAEQIGITPSKLGHYENGRAEPDIDTLYRLSTFYGISLDEWLNLSIEHKHPLVAKYHALDEYGKRAIDALLDIETTRIQQAIADEDAKPKTRFIERYYLPVSAGSGVYIDSNIRQREMVEVPVNEKTAKASFVLTVKGDSMEPRYSDGDEILIQSMPSVDIGDLGIFILNDEVYFKRMGRKGLESLNPKYPVINVTENDTIVCKGKVIGKL
jgi:repressor LexA